MTHNDPFLEGRIFLTTQGVENKIAKEKRDLKCDCCEFRWGVLTGGGWNENMDRATIKH